MTARETLRSEAADLDAHADRITTAFGGPDKLRARATALRALADRFDQEEARVQVDYRSGFRLCTDQALALLARLDAPLER